MASSVALVSAPVCPFAQRAWLTLLELGVPFELKETSLTDKPAWFSETYAKAVGADPASNGKVPVLVDGDFVLTESAVVSEYLINKYGPAATAADFAVTLTPEERARSTIFVEQIATKVVKGYYALLAAQDEATQAAAAAELLKALASLSTEYARTPGPFFLGSKLSLADILVFPWIARFVVLQHYRAFKVPHEAAYAAYHAFVEAMEARESVKASRRVDVWIEGYHKYAHPAPK